ncbi:MAG: replication-relaxation family protein [bacterium]
MALTERDVRVVMHVGNFKVLSKNMIANLEFNTKYGEATFQRRLRKELKVYLDGPFYINVQESGARTPLYRLKKKGIQMYQEIVARKYKTPAWNPYYLPHLLRTNELIIFMYDIISTFELEKQINYDLRTDAYFTTKNQKKICIETDRGRETKTEIENKIDKYIQCHNIDNFSRLLLYSNRAERLLEWVNTQFEKKYFKIDIGFQINVVQFRSPNIPLLIKELKK